MKAASNTTAACAAFLVPVLLLLPFAGKAFHIDDPVYVWMARHIVEHPLDPYGISVFWTEATQPMYLANQNPPGIAYWLALVGSLFGFSETALHVSTALLSGFASLGTYVLAREFCDRPLTATLIGVLSPGFIVSASTVMTDVPMLTFYVWSLALWVVGVKRDRPWLLAGGATLMGVAFLFKYFGLTAIPLALVYSAFASPRSLRWAWLLVIPIGFGAGYIAWAIGKYDVNLLGFAAEFTQQPHWRSMRTPWLSFTTALAFSGGCAASIALLTPFVWPKRALPFVLAGAGVVVAMVFVPAIFRGVALPDNPESSSYRLQTGLWIAAGLHLFALTAGNLYTRRDAGAVLLACWIVGTFVFSAYVNYGINVRTLLPMLPALGILAVQRMGSVGAAALVPRRWVAAPLCLAGALAMWVAAADWEYANASRAAAKEFSRNRDQFSENVYFLDHWGFQFYMQEAGARSMESGLNRHNLSFYRPLLPGDTFVIGHVHSAKIENAEGFRTLAEYEYPMRTGMSTMTGGAGFYNHFLGMLPFTIGRPVPESFRFVLVP